jgi:hypothetical protein
MENTTNVDGYRGRLTNSSMSGGARTHIANIKEMRLENPESTAKRGHHDRATARVNSRVVAHWPMEMTVNR